ncbi:MAG TPA: M23 family metallopeptidase [Bryobacteraceae bacterium]|nr:M23 family metallopeptidase [Bryobacteraceae bacterium]
MEYSGFARHFGNMTQVTRRLLLNLMAGAAVAQDTVKPVTPRPPRPIDAPIDVMVPVPPTPFRANGKSHLVYELHVTNLGRAESVLTRVEVVSQDQLLASYAGDGFAKTISRPGVQAQDPLRIDGGLRAVIFIWVTLDAGVPSAIEHRIGLKVGDDEFETLCARTVVRKEAISIRPPLRGDGWMAANGPANLSGHRRALIPIGGSAHIAERFAIDWLQLDKNGQSYTGDRLDNKSYRCYGNELFAVADGVVVAMKDGIPENVPGATSRAVPITLETVGGNHIMVDIGGGNFAFYAHAQPGKIRVRLGDRVKEGQVLGLLGNSGNSTEPHLHFHICDANSPLGSEGLPYRLTAFDVQGQGGIVRDPATNSARFGWTPSNSTDRRTNEMPMQNVVVRFS